MHRAVSQEIMEKTEVHTYLSSCHIALVVNKLSQKLIFPGSTFGQYLSNFTVGKPINTKPHSVLKITQKSK